LHFNSVEKILAQLEKQPGWEKFRDYRQLLKCWHNTVNRSTADNTRPLRINRQILWVATNSASRAQELSLSRYALLKRLNKQLPFVLKDIRFSSSGWYQTTYEKKDSKILFNVSPQLKSFKSEKNIRDPDIVDNKLENVEDNHLPTEKAKAAAKRWLKTISRDGQNSSSLSCPQCGSSTPTGEIERWNSCYLCVAQKWSKEYRPPTFPESRKTIF